jgi:transposase
MADTGAAYQLFVGIDIAAETFTAAWLPSSGRPSAPLTCDQTAQGYGALQQRLERTAVSPSATLVVVEATGTYWVALAVALHEAGYRVAVVNPRQAHHFAKRPLHSLTPGAGAR